jgi:hypothetical protein
VLIGTDDNAVVFEFDPSVRAGAENLMTRRGEDARLERSPRRTTAERRATRGIAGEHPAPYTGEEDDDDDDLGIAGEDDVIVVWGDE